MSVVTELLPPRYEGPQCIAAGGMGSVYLAQDRDLRRSVAVKLLSERFESDTEARRRFLREALAAARLSGHPHIVTIFDVGEWDGRPLIVMEYLSQGSVGDRIRDRAVGTGQALTWLEHAADALDAAHQQGVVHRDVKPTNMLIDERGAVQLADFGIARLVDDAVEDVTAPGCILGTAGYLAPEQARGETATAASDRYALAIVAYELLTGRRPFEQASAMAEALAHIHAPIPPASKRNPALPRAVDDVFTRALAKDPRNRYETCRHFVQDLRAALESPARTTRTRLARLPTARPARNDSPQTAPRMRFLASLLLLALLVIAGTVGGVGLVLSLVVSGLVVGALGRLFHPGRDRLGLPTTILIGASATVVAGTLVHHALGAFQSFLAAIAVAVVLVALWSRYSRDSFGDGVTADSPEGSRQTRLVDLISARRRV
ncbi:MAG: serine/threonine protein kinase [Actinomycetota bacterium]|nr:serine/threonine protein kinase [Actinomycetota bacterium]